MKTIADLYYASFERIKRTCAERAILHPLGLDLATLTGLQGELGIRLSSEVLNFQMPEIEALITGRDDTGPHIYRVSNQGTSCQDWVAFASIGVGADHANSQLMFAGHNRHRDFAPTLFLVYSAKKRAEVAPGVGKATDMFFIEPPDDDGKEYYDLFQPIVDKVLDPAYDEMKTAADNAREQGIGRIDAWFKSLAQANNSEPKQPVEADSGQPQIGAGAEEPDSFPTKKPN